MIKKWIIVSFACVSLFCMRSMITVNAVDYGYNPDYIYYITGDYTYGDYDFYYGAAKHRIKGDFSALVIMKYHQTDTLYRTLIIDEGYNENTTFVGFLSEGTFGVVIEKFRFDYEIMDYQFFSTEILKYDIYGNYVTRVTYPDKFRGFNNHNYKIILSLDNAYENDIIIDNDLTETSLTNEYITQQPFRYQFQGECNVNGVPVIDLYLDEVGYYEIEISRRKYNYSFNVTVRPSLLGIEDNGEYVGSIKINSNGVLRLNGEIIDNEAVISEAGNHTLLIEGVNDYFETYHFTIIPCIKGVINNGEYQKGVYIEVSSGQPFLNGISYENNSLIAKPGKYSLEINGINDYRYNLNFTVLPSVINLENNYSYELGYCLNFIGEGKLNGKVVESGIFLDPGDYVFELWFENEIFQTYSFSVNGIDDEKAHQPLKIPYLEIILGVISLVGIFLVFKKK